MCRYPLLILGKFDAIEDFMALLTLRLLKIYPSLSFKHFGD